MPQPADPSLVLLPGRPGPDPDESGGVWDGFDAESYLQANYAHLRDDDRYLLAETASFLAAVLSPQTPGKRLMGVDVGTGPNLYPALAMLPFCRDVDLWERSAGSCRWLAAEVRSYSAMWDDYWDVVAERQHRPAVSDPRKRLSRAARVRHADLFRLPARAWDVGTMFFTAESITDRPSRFALAVSRFVGALRPGAPYAAAFMRDSHGYPVGKQWFPAVPVDTSDVEVLLAPHSRELRVSLVISDTPLREGYAGMVLALGIAG